MNFKGYIRTTSIIIIVLALAVLVLGIAKWSENPYTGIIYAVVGFIQLLGMVLLFPRIAKLDDQKEVGNRAVQANWIVLSLGIAGMALFLAPFFRLESVTVSYVAFILSVVLTVLSAFNIFIAVNRVKARMVV
ncbi:MAG: hypothetical protein JXQ30_15490 [Spirochaetes bacterium]|nr:hypothetical protein [Spirochaetota bacterium]